VFTGHNATNPAWSSGRNGVEAAGPWDTTSPTLRDLRAATARRQRVFGHNATNPARTAGRNGAEAPCPSDTTPTLHRDPPGRIGRSTTYPSDPRMSIQRTFAGVADRLGGSGWLPPGVETERLAEQDGPGSTCPSWASQAGESVSIGRNGPGPPHLSGCNGRGLARPSGATGSNHRTLAGATVGASSTHRSRGTQSPECPPGTTANTVRHVRSGTTNRGLGPPSGGSGSSMTSGFPNGLSPPGSGLSGSGSGRPFGTTVQLWENFRATSFLEKGSQRLERQQQEGILHREVYGSSRGKSSEGCNPKGATGTKQGQNGSWWSARRATVRNRTCQLPG
jgi:hypothetical protein